MRITARAFYAATGRKPINDDLERANCDLAGQFTHSCCGWCSACSLPVFNCGHQIEPADVSPAPPATQGDR